jgi:hypothetical protein
MPKVGFVGFLPGSEPAFIDNYVNSSPRLWFDEKNGRGLADFDVGQNLTVNYIWKIPSLKARPRALQWALNSW